MRTTLSISAVARTVVTTAIEPIASSPIDLAHVLTHTRACRVDRLYLAHLLATRRQTRFPSSNNTPHHTLNSSSCLQVSPVRPSFDVSVAGPGPSPFGTPFGDSAPHRRRASAAARARHACGRPSSPTLPCAAPRAHDRTRHAADSALSGVCVIMCAWPRTNARGCVAAIAEEACPSVERSAAWGQFARACPRLVALDRRGW